jgi:hypothetical protein
MAGVIQALIYGQNSKKESFENPKLQFRRGLLMEKYLLPLHNKKLRLKLIVIPFPLQPPGLGLEGECLRRRPVLQIPTQHVHVGPSKLRSYI